ADRCGVPTYTYYGPAGWIRDLLPSAGFVRRQLWIQPDHSVRGFSGFQPDSGGLGFESVRFRRSPTGRIITGCRDTAGAGAEFRGPERPHRLCLQLFVRDPEAV